MRRSFSYTLLITWVLLLFSCKSTFVQKSYESENISVTDKEYPLKNEVVAVYDSYRNALNKDMQRVISYSEFEMVL